MDREYRAAVGALLDESDECSISDNTDVELDASDDGTSIDGGGGDGEDVSGSRHSVSSLSRDAPESGLAATDGVAWRLREEEMAAADLTGFMPRLLAALRLIHGMEIVPLTGIDVSSATMALNECCWHEAGLMLRSGSESYRAEVMTRSWVPTTITALVAIHVLNGNSIHVVCPLLVMAMYPLSASALGADPVRHLRRVYAHWREMLASVDGEILPDIEPLFELAANMVREGWCGTGVTWVRDVQYSVYDTTQVVHGRGAALMRLCVDARHRALFTLLRSHERDHLFSRETMMADRYVDGRLGLNMTWIHVATMLSALSLRTTRDELVGVDALRQMLSIRHSDPFLRPFQDLIVLSTCSSMYLYVTLALSASCSAVTCSIPFVPTPDATVLEPRVMSVSAALARVAKASGRPLPLVNEAPRVRFVNVEETMEPTRIQFCERRLQLIASIPTMINACKRNKWSSADIKLVEDYYHARMRGERGARGANRRIPRLLRRLRNMELDYYDDKKRYKAKRDSLMSKPTPPVSAT